MVVTAVQEASLRGQIAATVRLLELQHQLTDKVQKQRVLGTAERSGRSCPAVAGSANGADPAAAAKATGSNPRRIDRIAGRLPADEPVETFRLDQLTLPADLPVSLPSKLIEQRPDVRQAEENLHAPSAAVGVAIANMLPQFAINGDLGSSALQIAAAILPVYWLLGCGRLADPDAVRCRGAACTRSVQRMPRSIKQRHNIAVPSFSPAKMSPIPCVHCRRTAMRCVRVRTRNARPKGPLISLDTNANSERSAWSPC